MQLDQMVVTRLRRPIMQVWENIASDASAMCGDDNVGAIEMSIDAGRLVEHANDREADELVQALCNEHDYDAVLDFLSNNIQLA